MDLPTVSASEGKGLISTEAFYPDPESVFAEFVLIRLWRRL